MKRIIIFLALLMLASPVWAGGSKGVYGIGVKVSGTTLYPNTHTYAKLNGLDVLKICDMELDGYFEYAFTSVSSATAAGTTGVSVWCKAALIDTPAVWAATGVSYVMTNIDAYSGATFIPVYCSPTRAKRYYKMGFYSGNTCNPIGELGAR